MKRREALKYLSVTPLAGGIVATTAKAAAPEAIAAARARGLVEELGIRSFINAAGTYTAMTASLMQPEVIQAIQTSSRKFVMLDEVQDKVGEKIAAICHSEAAMVTAGCWSALVLGTAGVLTGTDQEKIAQLPDVSNLEKNEVILQKGHNHGYIHALTNTGIKPVVVETSAELERAVNSKTALMYFLNESTMHGKILHEEWLAVAKKHGIPTIIDIAADIPPVENLWKYNDMGFDLVCISGGKALKGPQSAGLLLGRKDLIAAARLNAPPRGGNIGRGMKVNKEEILGMYVALEKYVNTDHEAEWKEWEKRVATIESAVKQVAGVSTQVTVPPIANHTPTLTITWDNRVKITNRDLSEKLRNGNPSIEVMRNGDGVNLTVFMLEPGEAEIVANRLHEEFSAAV
ncbi:selenocysteine synthase [Parapedobacter lycopersici]|uniref:selenocysteine synthase n=1 Tax=Parapedobacter lycopersici TaxID=1864939 RepID=UPI00214D5CEB|nr:selenocysteine synthase [Parapedobacter lycopersici]